MYRLTCKLMSVALNVDEDRAWGELAHSFRCKGIMVRRGRKVRTVYSYGEHETLLKVADNLPKPHCFFLTI